MTPSENRRFYRAGVVAVLAGMLLTLLSQALDVPVGWVYLVMLLMVVPVAVYVHRERPDEEDERREFARENGLPYPPPPRKRWPRR
jgi:hypothetical protein